MPRLTRIGLSIIVAIWLAASASAGVRAATADQVAGPVFACTLGETHAANVSLNQIDLTGFTVYQLLDPVECAACSGGLSLDQATWRLRYFGTAQCALTFELTIVASDGASCPKPDTTHVICAPMTFVYTPTGNASPTITVPLPAGCCITVPAFIRWRVVNTGGCGVTQLGFFAYAPGFAVPCRSYASSPVFPFDDSTNNLGMYPTIAVAAQCCSPTPTRTHTWGGLKLRYR